MLQTVDPTTRIDSPYDREPQVGARYAGPWRGGFDVAFEGEFNRFSNPDDHYLAERQTGLRAHALGSIAPAVLLARLDGHAEALVQRRVATRSTCRSPTAGAARRA